VAVPTSLEEMISKMGKAMVAKFEAMDLKMDKADSKLETVTNKVIKTLEECKQILDNKTNLVLVFTVLTCVGWDRKNFSTYSCACRKSSKFAWPAQIGSCVWWGLHKWWDNVLNVYTSI
jgi:hypothetical protein